MSTSITKYKWFEIDELGEPRVYATVAICNGLIYLVGGCNKTGMPVNSIEVYDPVDNKWSKVKAMPTKRAAPIVAVIESRIVVIGGVGTDQLPVNAVEIFIINENKWKMLSPLSEPLMGMAHVVKDNKVLIFGGMAVDTNPRDHFKCLVVSSGGGSGSAGSTEKWQAFTPMPTARYAAQAFHRNSKVYVLGGRQGKYPVAAFEVWDMDSRSWTKYPDIPTKRIFPCYCLTDKYIISIGGMKNTAQFGFSDACDMYSTEDNERSDWITNKRMAIPTKRGDFTGVTVDNQVVVAGGLGNQGTPLSSTEWFDTQKKRWSNHSSELNYARCTGSSVVHQGRVYVLGGIGLEGPTGKCEVFKLYEEDLESKMQRVDLSTDATTSS